MNHPRKKRVGIIGFGKLGQALYDHFQDPSSNQSYELGFVWNRNPDKLKAYVPESLILEDLENFDQYVPDLIVEVCHPNITHQYGESFLQKAAYFVGSPTAFARPQTYEALTNLTNRENGKPLLIPRGALPANEEISRLAEQGLVHKASIAMVKHPSSLRFKGNTPELKPSDGPHSLYDGPLDKLCELAPNNVNTMAALGLACGKPLSNIHASLVADASLKHHLIDITLQGPPQNDGTEPFELSIHRKSPAPPGAVTSKATVASFIHSVLRAPTSGPGLRLC